MSEEVNIFNELQFRQKFTDEVGHTVECVSETIDDMLSLMAKTYLSHGIPEEFAVTDAMTSLELDESELHLRSILSQKECECDGLATTNTH